VIDVANDLRDAIGALGRTVRFEVSIHRIDVRDGARFRLDRQVIAHETVKHRHIFRPTQALFHGIPVRVVQSCLLVDVQPHEHEIADEIRLRQLKACRVQALEDELRIVIIPVEGDIHNDEFVDARAFPNSF
jgi:hypothetical protein